MKSPGHLHGVISVVALAVLMTACAAVQAPLPPSLELPRPPNDLRAVRKGDRVYLFWTTPTRTIDHQSVRRPGPTRICRSLENAMNSCGTPVGNQAPIARTEGEKKGMPAVKPEARDPKKPTNPAPATARGHFGATARASTSVLAPFIVSE